ncbi:MAG: hypothetical protein SGILL_003342 [Bacillariaceae sp.]
MKLSNGFSLLVLWSFLVAMTMVAAADADGEQTCENMEKELNVKNWVVEAGGAFNDDKLEFRRKLYPGVVVDASSSDDGDDAESLSGAGIFAKKAIAKGETLMKIPAGCVLVGRDRTNNRFGLFSCTGIQATLHETRKGDESFFAPYTDYLKLSKKAKMVPTAWSTAAHELMIDVLGYKSSFKEVMLPPKDPITLVHVYRKQCRKNKVAEEEGFMAVEHLTRKQGNSLVPLLDMLGHGETNINVELSEDEEGYILAREVVASRDIQAGEELRFSYYAEETNEFYGVPELFRDHGIVDDNFPQPWVFRLDSFILAYNLTRDETADGGDGEIKVEWSPSSLNVTDYFAKSWVRRQLHRIENSVEPTFERIQQEMADDDIQDGNEKLPSAHELFQLRRYIDAVRVSLEHVQAAIYLRELEEIKYREIKSKQIKRTNDEHGNFPSYNEQDYDALKEQGWETLSTVQSAYQKVEIKANHENVCFVLDDEPQTCSYFSAHYHDIASHFPTRYLESVKRVAILGGGDSKILQDMLQYNSTLEKVIHLELDQVGTRLCFKHFLTDPHFEDDRIEWYFGDAAKSLRMLPSDYFGTFDVVFVDMSESGPLSYGVTEDLTVWESIAQLLSPDGMLVKNELYHEIMSQTFDNTLLLYYEKVPIIESWALSIGTNRKDLLSPDPATITKWQDVKTHLSYVEAAAADIDDHFRMAHDYYRSDARAQGRCEAAPDASSGDSPLGGILMIVEAEDVAVGDAALTDWSKLEKILSKALKKQKLSKISSVSLSDKEGTNGIIILKEGVITARTSLLDRYCAFDIHMWGSFDKINSVRDGLAKGLGSKVVSSYRLIAAGMRGNGSEAADKKKTGPPGINNRDCSSDGKPAPMQDESETPIAAETINTVIEQSIGMIQDEKGTIAVLCGSQSAICQSFQAVSSATEDDAQLAAEAIWTCPGVEAIDASQNMSDSQISDMLVCNDAISKQISEAVSKHGKVSALVLDSTAPLSMLMIIDRFWRSTEHRENLVASSFTFLAPMKDASADELKREFLEMWRQELVDYDHLFRAEVILQQKGATDFELGILSGQDPVFFPRLVNVTNVIQEKTGIPTIIQKIEGGIEELDLDQQDMEWLTESVYARPAEEHFNSQKPLGEQTFVQYRWNSTQEFGPDLIEGLFKDGYSKWIEDGVEVNIQKEVVGKGLAITAVCADATAVVIWDGEDRLDLNVLVFDAEFLEVILNPFEKLKAMKRLSFDYLPRGIGKVINFEADLDSEAFEETAEETQ